MKKRILNKKLAILNLDVIMNVGDDFMAIPNNLCKLNLLYSAISNKELPQFYLDV